jgi:hypothetical protein
MRTFDPIRGMARGLLRRPGMLGAMCALAVTMLAVSAARAQVAPYGEKTMGDPAQDHLPDILERIKITDLVLGRAEWVGLRSRNGGP